MIRLKALKYFLVFLFIATNVNASPDKIGNGGGVWVCESSSHETFDILFMDVFEARREYQLNLPETNASVETIVASNKDWIERNMKDSHNILKHIEYVEKNITWIDDIINFIPDGANKITPHPSLCKQGDWKPVQLVNFTDDFRVLVRRDLFESQFMSNLEKAAVYLHEGIYSYLRDFGDSTSVRARAIVGFLLSDLPDSQKLDRIQKILDQASPINPPEPAPQTWICGLRPDTTSALYIAESASAETAKSKAIENCSAGENPFPFPAGNNPGFPQPPQPGLPPAFPPGVGFPMPGPQMDCKANLVYCEPVSSQIKSKWCTIKIDFFTSKSFKGFGRTNLEAQKETQDMCLASEGDSYQCKTSRNMECN